MFEAHVFVGGTVLVGYEILRGAARWLFVSGFLAGPLFRTRDTTTSTRTTVITNY